MKTVLSLLAACALLVACAAPAPMTSSYANCKVKQESFAGMKPQPVLSCG